MLSIGWLARGRLSAGIAKLSQQARIRGGQHQLAIKWKCPQICREGLGWLRRGRCRKSIEAVSRRLAKILNIQVDFDTMRETSTRWEVQVSEAVQQDEELAATVRKLEEAYDNELIEEQSD